MQSWVYQGPFDCSVIECSSRVVWDGVIELMALAGHGFKPHQL
jgi:hypothetical protein